MENEKQAMVNSQEYQEQAAQADEVLADEALDEVSGGLLRVRHYAALADLKASDDQPSLRRTIRSDLRAV
jgi:hypothetical protein